MRNYVVIISNKNMSTLIGCPSLSECVRTVNSNALCVEAKSNLTVRLSVSK